MPRPYSNDLRERAIDEVRSGASHREVAEHFDVCPSAVINWMRRWRETGPVGIVDHFAIGIPRFIWETAARYLTLRPRLGDSSTHSAKV